MQQRVPLRDTVNMIAYGLSKFGGTIPGVNRFANLLGMSHDDIALALLGQGLITSPQQLLDAEVKFNKLFLNIAEVWDDPNEKAAYVLYKESIDSCFGDMGAAAYAGLLKKLERLLTNSFMGEEASALLRCYALQDGILRPSATEPEKLRYEVQFLAVQLAARRSQRAAAVGFTAPHEIASKTEVLDELPFSGQLRQCASGCDAVILDGDKVTAVYQSTSEGSLSKDILSLADIAVLLEGTGCETILVVPDELRAMAFRTLRRPILTKLDDASRPKFITISELWERL